MLQLEVAQDGTISAVPVDQPADVLCAQIEVKPGQDGPLKIEDITIVL